MAHVISDDFAARTLSRLDAASSQGGSTAHGDAALVIRSLMEERKGALALKEAMMEALRSGTLEYENARILRTALKGFQA